MDTKKTNFYKLVEKVNNKAQIIAVSKSVDKDAVAMLASFGQCDFAENKVQELKNKILGLGNNFNNLKWHFIGRLQSNKINQLLALKPVLWQSCNGLQSALEVEKRLNFTLPCLLQINSANEASKQGCDIEKAKDEYLQILNQCQKLKICGVMSIGANSDNIKDIIKSFEVTFKIFDELKAYNAKICSMGMSDDYEIALNSGSNMLRLGRILWQ